MKFLSDLARGFNSDKWWGFYEKAKNTKGVMKEYYTFRYMHMASKNGGYCGRETIIKGKLNLPHGFHGIHISRQAVIGKNVTIFQNVTIGTSKGGAPQIGNDSCIYAGSNLVGKIVLGDNVIVGAGTTLFENIPDKCTVVGEKPRIIYHPEIE